MRRAGIVKAWIGVEVRVQTLRERRKLLKTLRPIEECRCPGYDQKETWEAPRVDLVDQLAQCIQPLLAHVSANALERLYLVEHDQEPRMSGIAEHDEQPL